MYKRQVYCLYAVVSGIYMCFLSEHDDVKAFYNIIFFFIAVCLVGLVEELVFRGVVFNLLLRAFPKTKGGITAVSYTHLDVYKRQAYTVGHQLYQHENQL